jgi:rRNA maturation RNase YbeY
MIEFNFETTFELENQEKISKWILSCIEKEGFSLGEINYVFCDDAYLHKLNVEFLNHDTLTDIISFDNTMGKQISGDIFISIERVKENSNTFNVSFLNELHRVMIHGVLHYLGYKDKNQEDQLEMTSMENESLSMLSI